ncbi:outer membrane beta-barrel family protein [Frigoriflavimonas asaccharolytica]|uniref:Outer membrane protein beta-barrel domain-containing protein n=1 Tax=Frigoriflavimonas asaccharolytica TaxID=2735899 RepID=A0A8J8K3U5_9FLAO|nr:outer membrane beta-barrel family protein [Frigoriflavimonas asaccharolytica]NRS91020.1 hypothetical protein [Frigoriflavimonas asaccharolytica]
MKKIIILLFTILFQNIFCQTKDTLTKTKNIETVTIKGKKKTFERKVDRFVYNVQNSMISEGSSGIEVLASTPLLKIDEDKGLLSIVGKSGVSVMVNDRMLHLSGSELMNYLKTIRSENILKIEVITTPPAKYEAQGNSGIINIVLKKNQNLGWNGYANSYFKQSTYAGFGGSFGLNFQNEKIKTSLKLRGFDTDKKSIENYSFIGNNSEISRDERRDMNDGLGLNLTFDYASSKNSNIGFIYDISKEHLNMDINSTSNYFTQNINTLNTETDAKHLSDIKSQQLNLYYDQKFGEHQLSFAANYYGNTPETNVNFTTTDLENTNQQTAKNQSTVDYHIYSGQADLSLNFKKTQVETGLKYSEFSNNSDIRYFDLVNNEFLNKPEKSDLFTYNERNYAAYGSASKKFGGKWSAKFGLRYEFADTNGISLSTQLNSKNSYGKLFPTAYISYEANDNNEFSLNYSRRINRPYFRALNPFRWYSNPYNYSTGNPVLQASFNHNVEFNYIFKSKFSANIYFQRSEDNFDQLSFLDGIYMVSTFQNYFNQNSYGINLNYSDSFFKFWETNLSTSYSYNNTQIFNFDAIPQNGQSFYYATNNTFQLNKQKTVFLSLNYWQSLPSKSGNEFSENSANLSAGIKMNLLQKALQVNLSINDVFRQSGYRGTIYFADNLQTFNNYWDARKFTFSVTYNFGNEKLKAKNRAIDFDEKDRAQ